MRVARACDIAVVNMKGRYKMDLDISLILKIVGIGVLVAVSTSILNKTGRDEQAMFVTLAGIITVMLMLIGEIGGLFETVRSTFGF